MSARGPASGGPTWAAATTPGAASAARASVAAASAAGACAVGASAAAASAAARRLSLGLLVLVGATTSACGGDREPELPEAERQTAILTARSQGLALLQQDRLEEAEAEFARLVALAPDEPAGYANLALVHLRRGELDRARELAGEALERRPDDADLRLILARIHEEAGRLDEAREQLEAALAADPNDIDALFMLARLEAGGPAGGGVGGETGAAGRTRAEELLRRILERAPGNLAVRTELAGLLISDGRLDAATAQLEEVRSLAPAMPDEASEAWDGAIARLAAGEAEAAGGAFSRFREVVSATAPYQADLQGLEGPRGEASGFPLLRFSHELSLQVPEPAAVYEALRFRDATEFSGLGEPPDDTGGTEADAGAGRGAGVGARRPPPADRGGPFARTADLDADADRDVFAWSGGAPRLLRNDLGRFVDITPAVLRETTDVVAGSWGDADDDGRPDLYLVREGANRLLRNEGDGAFEEVASSAGVADEGWGYGAAWADLDTDGDLDLFVANQGADRVYRNDGDGTFTERAAAMGLAGGDVPSYGVAFGDVDGDVDVDLVVARGDSGVVLYRNERQATFSDATGAAGLAGAGPTTVVRLGDYDNDGLPDLLLAGPGDGAGALPLRLYRNQGDGLFTADGRSEAGIRAAISGGGPGRGPDVRDVRDAAFLDFDNDGHLDLVVATGAGVVLLRGRGEGTFAGASEKLPESTAAGRPEGGGAADVEVFDYNEDGDLDLLVGVADGGLRLLRNDGGNVNHHVQVRLVGRGAGSGKVNRLGIGSTVELRAGDLYQSRIATEPVVHFGLGSRLKADVIRVVWTNGVPQDLYFPGTDQDLIESQTLKGSCAFVYGWDGEKHVFVTDAMWKSAIGMPLGIMAGPAADGRPRSGRPRPDGAAVAESRVYAPPRASQEYLRIPGELLRPVNGRYRLQLTEELWEVAYVDEVKLLAVDHPDGVEVYVDERFLPPAPPRLRLFAVERADRRPPSAATDGAGNDLLPELRARDSAYAGNLVAGPYQGVVRPHELILDLGSEVATAERPVLFLRGWIFPTDASINVAVAQSEVVEVMPPVLEVPDGRGGWKMAVPDLSFPAGKDKTVVVELAGLLDPADPRVRIRTNMQIYWDHAFAVPEPVAALDVSGRPEDVATRTREAAVDRRGDAEASSPRLVPLPPAGADLHYRGFSREYRKGGRRGPHWFDYGDVSSEPRWLPIAGRYTRYGEVGELLLEADDRYAILGPGDEMTVEFDPGAAGLPVEAGGGRARTFLLYTDGWIKDADLNTATGQTVEPLPFHAQSAYPPPAGEAFPDDPAHRGWRERYNTREVKPRR